MQQPIRDSIGLLTHSLFICRKATSCNAFPRELLISFGVIGYVALFEIDDAQAVTILALRHLRQDEGH